MKILLPTTALALATAILTGCDKSHTVVRHGDITLNANNLFTNNQWIEFAEIIAQGNPIKLPPDYNRDLRQDKLLWWSLWCHNKPAFDYLIDGSTNANISISSTLPGLMILATDDQDSTYLQKALLHGGSPTNIDLFRQRSPLVEAISLDLRPQTDLLLKYHPDLSWQSPISGETLPFAAVYMGNYETAARLIEMGAPYTNIVFNESIQEAISFNHPNTNSPDLKRLMTLIKPKPQAINGKAP